MTIAPSQQPGPTPGATPARPITNADLDAATPLLLGAIKPPPAAPATVLSLDPAALLSAAAAAGVHIVHRPLAPDDRHFYRMVYSGPVSVTFKTFFVQPSNVAAEALHLTVIVREAYGTVSVRDNTGSSVAHGAEAAAAAAGGDEGSSVAHGTGGAEGSSVAHGAFGPLDLVVFDGAPTYYLMIGLIDGNTPVADPYTVLALTI
jgi:hypothetical protein